ncbi:MAG: tannase/feruloyl esterase family alpha/beta hydrolase [Acidobacteriota bacterium]
MQNSSLGGNPNAVRRPVAFGFAAGATDTGHEGGSVSFAVDANGRLNWMLIRDNAYLGIHEMTVTGKALTEAFYGKPPRYSYFNGCSTGGRQGLMEAQRSPADYEGIHSAAPAINWSKLHIAQMWSQLVVLETRNFLPPCKFAAAQAATVAACDAIDGFKDGVIEDPRRCSYDPKALAGAAAGECGANFALSATDGMPLTGRPFNLTLDWWKYFLTKNPQWDWATLTYAAFEQFWDQSVEQFGAVLGTDSPNLSAFRDRGGKAIVWHGWVDPAIHPEGTIDYYERVQQRMGGPEKTAEFIRLFMAPGVGHCGGGPGPGPLGPFDALLKWVEEGKAPDTLNAARRDQAGNVVRTRPLCQYPLVARYKGSGSTDDAANFVCAANF